VRADGGYREGVEHATTELHFHLLPDIDDGPETVEEAIALARLAVADGTETVVCTPHAKFVSGPEDVVARVDELRAALRAANVPLTIRPGAELSPDDVGLLGQADLEAMAQGPANARWLLLEAPLVDGQVDLLHEAANDLADRGFGIVLGHPERCRELLAPGGGLEELRAAGARIQLNASSITGYHGTDAQEAALKLATAGKVSVVASDAHRVDRPPRLREAVEVLRKAGVRDAERMASTTPVALLRHGLKPLVAAT
jgi:protein-tyrosine phosphatase